jgi:hypothetical protein
LEGVARCVSFSIALSSDLTHAKQVEICILAGLRRQFQAEAAPTRRFWEEG